MRRCDPQLLLREIYRKGPISRAELAQRIGSAPSCIGNMVGEVKRHGFVIEVGLAPSKLGRRRVLLRVNPDLAHLIGLDVGTAMTRVITTDLAGRILTSRKMPSEIWKGGDHVLDVILRETAKCLEADPKIKGIGVAHSGLVNRQEGTVVVWPKVRGWENVPLRQVLADKFNLPTMIEDSTRAMAIAEQRFGHGAGVSNFIYVSVGMGLGSAIFINGELYLGGGLAGELGHTTQDERGELCSCGNRGCLEVVSSGWAILGRVRSALQGGVSSSLSKLYDGTMDQLSIEAIVEAAAAHDRLSETVLTEAAAHLGTALAGIANLLHPEKIILGAAVPQAARDLFVAPLIHCLRRRAFQQSVAGLEVVVAKLGEESAGAGVALLVGEDVLAGLYAGADFVRKDSSEAVPANPERVAGTTP